MVAELVGPQGNGAIPMLANIFLHYVLDNCFDVVVRNCNIYLRRLCV